MRRKMLAWLLSITTIISMCAPVASALEDTAAEPTPTATVEPTEVPTEAPAEAPEETAAPTEEPSEEPTAEPTEAPTEAPLEKMPVVRPAEEAESTAAEADPETAECKAKQQEMLDLLTDLDENDDVTLSATDCSTGYDPQTAVFLCDSEEQAQAYAESLGAELTDYFHETAVISFPDKDVKAVMQEVLDSDELYPLIEPNLIYLLSDEDYSESLEVDTVQAADSELAALTNDPYVGNQWALDYINIAAAWDKGITGNGVTVAVLDSGVAESHEDLPTDIKAYDLTGNNNPYDEYGHGTYCISCIAAVQNNGIGITGIAPDVQIYSYKVTNGKSVSSSNIIKGVYAAADAGCDVISCSFSGYEILETEQTAYQYAADKGCVVVAAAGNDDYDSGNGSSYCSYPASFDTVIGVSALYNQFSLSRYAGYSKYTDMTANGASAFERNGAVIDYYSNYGSLNASIAAPGSSIYMCKYSGGYAYSNGTSFACPITAAVVALVISGNKDYLTTAQANSGDASFVQTVTNDLYTNCTKDMGDDPCYYYGNGGLDCTNIQGSGSISVGLHLDSDGAWRYYRDGAVDTDYTGLVLYSGNWYYVKEGVLDWSYTGLVQYTDGNWYYVQNGILNWGYTGLVQHTNGGWFYVRGGILDWNFTGLVQYSVNGGWFYVQGGMINWNYTGLVQHTNGYWYYVNGGVLDWSFTGLVQYTDNNLYYVKNGAIDWSFNGEATWNDTQYHVTNGMVQMS